MKKIVNPSGSFMIPASRIDENNIKSRNPKLNRIVENKIYKTAAVIRKWMAEDNISRNQD